jgi:hypothetical protein
MAKKKTTKKKPANRKRSSKSKPANARTLTQADHEKIQRLLGTAELGKVRLAIELTEETCSVVAPSGVIDVFRTEIMSRRHLKNDFDLLLVRFHKNDSGDGFKMSFLFGKKSEEGNYLGLKRMESGKPSMTKDKNRAWNYSLLSTRKQNPNNELDRQRVAGVLPHNDRVDKLH